MICFSLINTEGCSVLRPLFLHSERGVYFQLWEITHRRFKQWRRKTSSFLLGPTQPTKDYSLSQWKDGLRFTANAPWRRATISERTYNVSLQHLDASRSLHIRLDTDKARARWPGWYFFLKSDLERNVTFLWNHRFCYEHCRLFSLSLNQWEKSKFSYFNFGWVMGKGC